MPVLTDAELRMVTSVVSELAKVRSTSFDKAATGFTFARAALIDPAFKERLAEVHRRLETRRRSQGSCLRPSPRSSVILNATLRQWSADGASRTDRARRLGSQEKGTPWPTS
jgi:hypothetical protein